MPQSRRQYCSRCQRPLPSCICDLITPVHNSTPLLLLQHPSETLHPKGSANLLQLSLQNCERYIAEIFEDLNTILDEGKYQNVLLYPDDAAMEADSLTSNTSTVNTATRYSINNQKDVTSAESINDHKEARSIRLVVIDGTWRKAFKILQLNPLLASLPRYKGDLSATTEYTIRKAPKAGQLSTLEACCLALGEIETAPERYQPLLDAFVQFNQRWLKFTQQ